MTRLSVMLYTPHELVKFAHRDAHLKLDAAIADLEPTGIQETINYLHLRSCNIPRDLRDRWYVATRIDQFHPGHVDRYTYAYLDIISPAIMDELESWRPILAFLTTRPLPPVATKALAALRDAWQTQFDSDLTG